jgi:DNA-binding XRE family transcriptional regulator
MASMAESIPEQDSKSNGGQYEPRQPRFNRLYEIRLMYGIMQQDLHQRGELSPATITAIERHGKYPQEFTRQKIARTLSSIAGKEITEQDIWPDETVV